MDTIKYTIWMIIVLINVLILKSTNSFAGAILTAKIGLYLIIGCIASGKNSIGNNVPRTNINLEYTQ